MTILNSFLTQTWNKATEMVAQIHFQIQIFEEKIK